MIPVIITLILLALLYILSTVCTRGREAMAPFARWRYAHRGLHSPGIPENSMAAFRAALEKGYGIELDIHLTADGDLAVIHDSALKRTTGREGRVEDLTVADLPGCFLEGTAETIPTFRQVLELYRGKAPLIIELKAVGNNHAALCAEACRQMEGYEGLWCMESFDPRCVQWLRKHRPEILRGQLAENFFRSKGKMPGILKFLLTHQMLNFLSRPHFVAYKYADRKTLSNTLVKWLWAPGMVSWTLQSPQELAQAEKEGWTPIFENFIP